MLNTIAILAGGLATRMKPLTETIPKALLDINGRPFLFHLLDSVSGQGITNVILCVGHLGETIKDTVGERYRNLSITYSFDGEKLLGTGGALKKAIPLLPESFFVQYGDTLLDIDYKKVSEVFCESSLPALMTVYRNEGWGDRSNAEFNGTLVKYCKSNPPRNAHFIDYGLLILNKTVFENTPQCFDFSLILEKLSHEDRLVGFEAQNPFLEIGSLAGLNRFRNHVLNK